MKAMILAAGLGTRLRPYSQHTPKALFTINEQPVLSIIIQKLQKAGFEAVMINTHHHYRQIQSYIAENDFTIPVLTRHESNLLGTGGGIRNIADFWGNQSLLVINADIVCDIDLAVIYQFHRTHGYPVTLVMHDHPQFNCVSVNANDLVVGFNSNHTPPSSRTLAFTGIHVVDRRVLNFLPSQGPAHIIDAYQKMISAGQQIKAYVATGHQWHDIGTAQSYQTAVYEHMVPKAFEAAFGRPPSENVQKHAIQGDGSDRRWYRVIDEKNSMIIANHGIRTQSTPQQVDAYVSIGQHLAANHVPVPQIYGYDRHAGLVFSEDVGNTHLQTIVKVCDLDQTRRLYQRIIDQWITMSITACNGFKTKWAYQTSYYDSHVVLENECRYFIQAFVQNYLKWKINDGELQQEFDLLAGKIMETQAKGFIHRDFQSRNIMVQNERIVFIDYQGGRIGPIQYDLASLLIDPYTALPAELQSELLTYAAEKVQRHKKMPNDFFMAGYTYCAVSRNLQILGAFAFLSQHKGKIQFEKYIPQAVKSLKRNLSCLKGISLPKLKKLTHRIIQQMNT